MDLASFLRIGNRRSVSCWGSCESTKNVQKSMAVWLSFCSRPCDLCLSLCTPLESPGRRFTNDWGNESRHWHVIRIWYLLQLSIPTRLGYWLHIWCHPLLVDCNCSLLHATDYCFCDDYFRVRTHTLHFFAWPGQFDLLMAPITDKNGSIGATHSFRAVFANNKSGWHRMWVGFELLRVSIEWVSLID